ncbi:hypothetical protein [Caballeronia fortuita]|uniref:hypothetical protein n=1 Tax=Caballeronia fortuita TaxID=1777138 RepID=UPI001428D4C9|nr:hypothetical protein [Caballeronia fortuita]
MIRKDSARPVPPKHERTVRLLEIMRTRRLKSPDVAKMLDRSSQTIRMWRCESKIIPDHALTALEVAVAELDKRRADEAKKRA